VCAVSGDNKVVANARLKDMTGTDGGVKARTSYNITVQKCHANVMKAGGI